MKNLLLPLKKSIPIFHLDIFRVSKSPQENIDQKADLDYLRLSLDLLRNLSYPQQILAKYPSSPHNLREHYLGLTTFLAINQLEVLKFSILLT